MYEQHKTLTGITIAELRQKLDEELPAGAYARVVGVGADLTDIKPAYMRRVLNDAFGLCGIGWGYRYEPASVHHRVFETTTHSGEIKTRHEAMITGLVFWYKLVDRNGHIAEYVIPATGGSENTSAAFALKGALTNAIGNAVSNLGFQESVYMDKRSHRTVKGSKGTRGTVSRKTKRNGGNGNAATVVVKFGKYEGHTLGEIAQQDVSYLEWLAENWKWQKGREAAAAVLAYHQAQQKATASKPPSS